MNADDPAGLGTGRGILAEGVGEFAQHAPDRFSPRRLEMSVKAWTGPRSKRPRPEFESAAHRAEFAGCLQDRYLPLKFAYTGTAAVAHSRFARSTGYRDVTGPVDAEAKALLAETPVMSGQLAEVGPGTGVHSGELLRALADSHATPHRYLALDFSSTLLGLALDHLAKSAVRPGQLSRATWDIEAGPTQHITEWRADGEPIALGFLGNTLGNVEDPQDVLTHLALSSRSGDVLALSVTLRSQHRNENEVLAPYRNRVFRSAALESFRLAGIAPDDLLFTVSYQDGSVIGMAECVKPVYFDGIEIDRGEHIRCFLSRRFTVEQVRTLLEASGWLVLRESDDADHLVVIAVRK